ncbi:MAG: nicotinate-nucleotide adenylyltransferase, partial [Ilumatobacter sp.]
MPSDWPENRVLFAIVSEGTPTPATSTSSARLGLFGGTFDPPHVGHLVTAVNVLHALELDQVILMVNNVPWQKEGTRQITPAADRLAMVVAAVDDVRGLVAGSTEINHGGNSYT